jgi:hypothetical protein
MGYIPEDVTTRFELPRVSRTIVPTFSDEKLHGMLAAPDRRTWVGIRDRAILLVLLDTLIRVSELVGLDAEDVDSPSRSADFAPLTHCGPPNSGLMDRRYRGDRGGDTAGQVFTGRRVKLAPAEASALLLAGLVRLALEVPIDAVADDLHAACVLERLEVASDPVATEAPGGGREARGVARSD